MTEAGVNAVAPLGTAFTIEQAQQLAERFKEIILLFDSDEAGQTAVRRADKIFKSVSANVSVTKCRGAKDPDEYIKTFGGKKFIEEVIEKRTSLFGYLLSVLATDNEKEILISNHFFL